MELYPFLEKLPQNVMKCEIREEVGSNKLLTCYSDSGKTEPDGEGEVCDFIIRYFLIFSDNSNIELTKEEDLQLEDKICSILKHGGKYPTYIVLYFYNKMTNSVNALDIIEYLKVYNMSIYGKKDFGYDYIADFMEMLNSSS